MSGRLSEKMSAWLGHVRAASERGVTLSAYAAQEGLSAGALYQAKAQLMKVGAWPRATGTKRTSRATKRRPRSRFVAVDVSASMSCRLSHVSGWSIECAVLPPVAWLHSLLRDVADAA
jgi:hypothetical protein